MKSFEEHEEIFINEMINFRKKWQNNEEYVLSIFAVAGLKFFCKICSTTTLHYIEKDNEGEKKWR